jgi:hypothetical protein
MSTTDSNATDRAGGAADVLARARALTASPLLYVGATTVVVAHGIAGRLGLSEFWTAVALFPLALVLLYAQLSLLVLYRRRYGRSGRTC